MASIQTPQLSASVAALSLTEKEAKQINYDQYAYKAPVYTYRQVQQTGGGGSSLTLGATSQSQTLFNIPNEPINLSRSYLMLDVPFAGVATVGKIDTAVTDCFPLYTVRLRPANGGDALVDVDNVQILTKVCTPLHMSIDEYLSRQGVFGDIAIGGTYPVSQCTGCQPYSIPKTRTSVQLQTIYPGDAYIRDAGTVSLAPDLSSASSGTIQDEKAPQHLVSGAANSGGTAAAGQILIRYKLKLGDIPGTLLAMDRTISFGQVMQLYLYWQPLTNWGFSCSNDAITTSAAAALAIGNTVAANAAVANFYLYLAIDRSDSGHEIQMLANSSGITFNMPFTVSTMFSPAAAGVQDVPVILTPGTGKLLKRIITVPSVTDQTLYGIANTDNVNGVKWTQVRSYLDSAALYDYPFVLADGTLYNYIAPFLKNTPAGMGQRNYEINCFYMDNFSDCNNGGEFNDNDFMASGLPIDKQRNYSARFTLVGTRVVYIFQVWSRQIVIKPTGISWAT